MKKEGMGANSIIFVSDNNSYIVVGSYNVIETKVKTLFFSFLSKSETKSLKYLNLDKFV